jgi:30S ribosomal protein S31
VFALVLLLFETPIMGKGDKKTKKGKIWRGSYGNSRKRSVNKSGYKPVAKAAKAEVEVVAKPKPKPKAKKAAKKKAKPADK